MNPSPFFNIALQRPVIEVYRVKQYLRAITLVVEGAVFLNCHGKQGPYLGVLIILF